MFTTVLLLLMMMMMTVMLMTNAVCTQVGCMVGRSSAEFNRLNQCMTYASSRLYSDNYVRQRHQFNDIIVVERVVVIVTMAAATAAV